MRRECRERFPHRRGLATPTCIRRSPRRGFLDHAFMLHCTILPQPLAQLGVRRAPLAPTAAGALIGGIEGNFANIGPINSIQLSIRYICNVPGMPFLMSVSKSTQVLSKFYFRDTPEQDHRAWEQ